MIWWPIHVGEELGYYEEEGLTINLLASETTIPYVAFLTNKNAHLAMLDGPTATWRRWKSPCPMAARG